MWQYEKKLQYPVKIANPNPALAKVIISQLGGPDGELGAALRYLNQRYSAPCREVQAILNDIGTEELAHIEMIGTIIYQLTRDLSLKEIKDSGQCCLFICHRKISISQSGNGKGSNHNEFIANMHVKFSCCFTSLMLWKPRSIQ
jgi:Mn-containing catalase